MRLLIVIAGTVCFTSGIHLDISPQIPDVFNGIVHQRGLEIRESVPDALLPETGRLDFNPNKYATDAQWINYRNKGERLSCLMAATDKGAGFLIGDTRTPTSAASRWTGDLENELEAWFWHIEDWDEGYECDFNRLGLGGAFLGLGLNARPAYKDDGTRDDGHNECYSMKHYNEHVDTPYGEQKYYVGGREYKATSAYYEFAMNKVGGAIIAKNVDSPSNAVQEPFGWGRRADPGELPELRFLSDIYWGYWIRNNRNIRNIRVYGAEHIVNDETVLLISRAFKNTNVDDLSPWPGTTFSAESAEGKALIGSPIGATITHMLIAHKAELGIKRISKVTVVTNDANQKVGFGERYRRDPHIFFSIEDVPVDQIKGLGNADTQSLKRGSVLNDEMGVQSRVVYVKNNTMVREHVIRFKGLESS